jgi:hypothetical protein
MTAPQIESTTDTDWDDDLVHLVCDCDEFWALCGKRLDDEEWIDDEDVTYCPMCVLVEDESCARCGQ